MLYTSSPRVLEKLLGSMLILEIITSGSSVTASELVEATKSYHSKDNGMHIDDLIWKVLSCRNAPENDLKQRVIKLIPKLSVAFSASFLHQNEYTAPLSYLQLSMKYLMETIKSKKDRGAAYLALGRLFLPMSSYLRSNVTEVFDCICEGFADPFCTPALECLGMVVNGKDPQYFCKPAHYDLWSSLASLSRPC